MGYYLQILCIPGKERHPDTKKTDGLVDDPFPIFSVSCALLQGFHAIFDWTPRIFIRWDRCYPLCWDSKVAPWMFFFLRFLWDRWRWAVLKTHLKWRFSYLQERKEWKMMENNGKWWKITENHGTWWYSMKHEMMNHLCRILVDSPGRVTRVSSNLHIFPHDSSKPWVRKGEGLRNLVSELMNRPKIARIIQWSNGDLI